MSRRARLAVALVVALAAGRAAPAAAQACADCLEAGAARVVMTVPEGTPLAGYGSMSRRLWIPDVLGRHPHAFWFKPAKDARDPLAARALVLEHRGRRLAWVTVDLVAVDRAFTAEVERGLAAAGVTPATLIVSASHTHSGPGAFVDSTPLGVMVLDTFERAVQQALVESVVSAVRRADAARRPARVASASVTGPPNVRSRLRLPLDRELVVLRVTGADGVPVALVWHYAIHGTMLGPQNLHASADVMGEASARLERALGVPALFVNGAVGDVSPLRHGDYAMRQEGAELAAAAREAWQQATRAAPPALAMAERVAALPEPWLSAKNCLRGWMPRALTLPLGSVFPRDARLIAFVVGDTAWVAFPGELQTVLGGTIKQAAVAPVKRALVAGLSNDYLGYFTTPRDYERPGYVTCATLYGPQTGTCLAAAAADLLRTTTRGEPPPRTPVACDADASTR